MSIERFIPARTPDTAGCARRGRMHADVSTSVNAKALGSHFTIGALEDNAISP
jgi:hypothetical protein